MKDVKRLVRKLVEESSAPLNLSPYSINSAIRRNINLIQASENLPASGKVRRKFILAGLVAALGAGALAADFLYGGPIRSILYPQNSTRGQMMTSLTELLTSSTSEVSSTASQVYSLSGRLFFDRGTSQFGTAGNGIQDDLDLEPGEPNAAVMFWDQYSKLAGQTTTDSSGDFSIDLPIGDYTMHPVPSSPDRAYGYMCQSASEFRSLDNVYDVTITENNPKMYIGLLQGFLSFPEKGIDLSAGFYDRYPNHQLAWNNTDQCWRNDSGTHFLAEEGDIIPSFAPGFVTQVFPNMPDNWVFITLDFGYVIAFAHNSEVLVGVGDKISRYQPVAKAGHRGYAPHTLVHLSLSAGDAILDPYKPIYPIDTVPYGYWTYPPNPTGAYIQPDWVSLPISDNINWQNCWIVENQLRFGPPYA